MTKEEEILQVNQEYIRRRMQQGERKDGRAFDELREITITPNYIHEKAEGSCCVQLGNTKVIAGVKVNVGTPFPDVPDEGVLMVSAEHAPLAASHFEAGPPGENSIELARVVDRAIRESGMIDTGTLCIAAGEAVYMVGIDIHVLDYDGNLIDAAAIASLVALLQTNLPPYDPETGALDRDSDGDALPVQDKALSITGYVIDDGVIFDPDYAEESIADARLTVGFKEDGTICSVQKGGWKPLTREQITDIAQQCAQLNQTVREKIKNVMAE